MELVSKTFMESLSPWEPNMLSLSVYMVMVFLIIGLLLFLCSRIRPKQPSPEKIRPYESGIIPTGSARLAYPVPFYMVAVFFLIFDLEGAFIFSWAIASRELGWTGWLRISFFIFVLLLGLVYIWKKGGLRWDSFSETE